MQGVILLDAKLRHLYNHVKIVKF